jgi:hypothetical protein
MYESPTGTGFPLPVFLSKETLFCLIKLAEFDIKKKRWNFF